LTFQSIFDDLTIHCGIIMIDEIILIHRRTVKYVNRELTIC